MPARKVIVAPGTGDEYVRELSPGRVRLIYVRTMRFLVAPLVAGLLVAGTLPAVAAEAGSRPDLRVAAYQAELAAAGFYRGAIDGLSGPMTRAAVLAFEKAAGLERDGIWDSVHFRQLEEWAAPDLGRSGEPDRFEIDITNQVGYLIRDDRLRAVFGISTGNGELYRHPAGYTARAATPRGDFTFYKYVDGLREAPLGVLYKPWYFRGGFALHGSPSVPAYPASHGCVRVTNWDADWLAKEMFVGMPVHVWEGERATPPTLAYETPSWPEVNLALHPV
ncbi:MAG TPA: L,D-transpeptidase family protein [Acidimicrobiia bacterium]|nr:L,D-transpeptidase family protein [Acidimicrobiia bacterium]